MLIIALLITAFIVFCIITAAIQIASANCADNENVLHDPLCVCDKCDGFGKQHNGEKCDWCGGSGGNTL